ncbi:MAG: ATP/GTP-binding protein [Acidobacteriota bacterium]
MPVVDATRKTVTLKIVYYGCALGGKTTNLETLHRLTDPERRQGMVSIATSDDRTLFFDLLPVNLGQIGGLSVRAKVYTVPGQLHYEMTRRQVLTGADGVVLVVDSSREARKNNVWARENLLDNLKANGLDPGRIPTVLQWNKRDLDDAEPVADLERELNGGHLPSVEAVATTGTGVMETFTEVLRACLMQAYASAGMRKVSEADIDRTLAAALAPAGPASPATREKASTPPDAVRHEVDIDLYREQWAERGRDRKMLDAEALYRESVQANMELAERLDGLNTVEDLNARRIRMLQALSRLAPLLSSERKPPLPPGAMAMLLAGAGRDRGSLLMFRPGAKVMDEAEVLPDGPDLLNQLMVEGLGSTAYQMSTDGKDRWIEDLAGEIFLEMVPATAEGLVSACLCPLRCGGSGFGSLIVYTGAGETVCDAVEREYWNTAASLLGLSLHWWSLNRQAAKSPPPPAAASADRP